MTIEIISWSISTKVWYRAGVELATPGSAVRHASVARHVTDCAMRPGSSRLWDCTIFHVLFQRTGRGHLFAFDPITGAPEEDIPSGGLHLDFEIVQSFMFYFRELVEATCLPLTQSLEHQKRTFQAVVTFRLEIVQSFMFYFREQVGATCLPLTLSLERQKKTFQAVVYI